MTTTTTASDNQIFNLTDAGKNLECAVPGECVNLPTIGKGDRAANCFDARCAHKRSLLPDHHYLISLDSVA